VGGDPRVLRRPTATQGARHDGDRDGQARHDPGRRGPHAGQRQGNSSRQLREAEGHLPDGKRTDAPRPASTRACTGRSTRACRTSRRRDRRGGSPRAPCPSSASPSLGCEPLRHAAAPSLRFSLASMRRAPRCAR
jgi:hypothetical protein